MKPIETEEDLMELLRATKALAVPLRLPSFLKSLRGVFD